MAKGEKIISDDPDRLLTIEDAADILQVSTKTIRRLIDEGALRAYQIRRQWRIGRADLRAYIAACRLT